VDPESLLKLVALLLVINPFGEFFTIDPLNSYASLVASVLGEVGKTG